LNLKDFTVANIIKYVSEIRVIWSRFVSRAYQIFLERFVMKLFRHPARAVICAFRSHPDSLVQLVDTTLCEAFHLLGPSPERVVVNYLQGMVLFGEHKSSTLTWKTFAERSVITAESARIPKRIKTYMNNGEFTVRMNSDFEAVLYATQRDAGTWISPRLADIYRRLHSMGFVDTVEVYRNEELVGGLWGLRIGRSHTVMSMFHRVDRGGHIAVGTLVARVQDGSIHMIDVGKQNANFARYGARPIPRESFIELLVHGLAAKDAPAS
jgi:leucyl/phenylalanyl-tRNA---protein transferase